MLSAVFQIMWLRLWRDKGALVLAFILPGFIFAIFAAIFSNASGGSLDLRVSMAVTSDAPASQTFANEIQSSAEFTLTRLSNATFDDIRERIRLGQDDVGLVIMGDLTDPSSPSITLITDPSRNVAATILKGQIRQILAEKSGVSAPELFQEFSALESTPQSGPADQSVTYYVGATAILFLLFSAMQGASLSLKERKTGIADRLLIGPKGAMAMLTGKFVFLTLIGTIQASIIVAVAALFFDVSIANAPVALALACVGTAALASGIALLTASLCSSTTQMQTVSTFVVLLFSAIGGSMVPRFMMPSWLQSMGQFTPNHWAIEAFYGTLARGQSVSNLNMVWAVLFGGAIVTLLLSALISHRLMRV